MKNDLERRPTVTAKKTTARRQTRLIFTLRPLRGFLTFLLISFSDNKKVDNARGKVESYVGLAVDDGDAVAVSVARPRHATTKDDERGSE